MDWWWIKIRSLHEAEDWVRPSLETEQNTLNNSLNLHCCRRWQSLQWILDTFPYLVFFQYFGFSAVANICDPLSISIPPFPCHVLPSILWNLLSPLIQSSIQKCLPIRKRIPDHLAKTQRTLMCIAPPIPFYAIFCPKHYCLCFIFDLAPSINCKCPWW